MKTRIAALAVIIAAGSLFAGEKVEINGEFKQLNPAKTAPAGWVKNFPKVQDIGTGKIVPAREKDENAFQITTSKRHTPYYTGKAYPVKPGDTIKMEADVKGSGKAELYVYLYDKGGYAATGRLASGQADADQFTKIKGSYTIKETYTVKRKGEKVEVVPSSARFVFGAVPKSDIVFENVEAEIESAKE